MSENTVVTAVAPKLTRAQKLLARAELLSKRIAKDTTDYNDIKAELEGAERLQGVDAGSLVKIKLGRRFSAEKDTTRIVAATVVAVREEDEGAKQYKVVYGTGFDSEVAVVTSAQIVEVAVEGQFKPEATEVPADGAFAQVLAA